jgi:hypothetical protein
MQCGLCVNGTWAWADDTHTHTLPRTQAPLLRQPAVRQTLLLLFARAEGSRHRCRTSVSVSAWWGDHHLTLHRLLHSTLVTSPLKAPALALFLLTPHAHLIRISFTSTTATVYAPLPRAPHPPPPPPSPHRCHHLLSVLTTTAATTTATTTLFVPAQTSRRKTCPQNGRGTMSTEQTTSRCLATSTSHNTVDR